MMPKPHRFNIVGQLATLRRYARSLTRDPDDAEDLVHDALVKAYERQASFRTDGNIRAWLLSIVHNTHIDRLRVRGSDERRHMAAAEVAEQWLPASQDQSVRVKQIREAFFELPDEQREALHLVVIEELSYQQAAEALGIPIGTLMSRISRARTRLRSLEDGEQKGVSRHLKLIGGTGNDQ
jgi:RNA polymerase sigma-70 factor (ECF subfamily)